MSALLHFEDFAAGQVYDLGTHTVTAEEIIEFAAEFDPQPQHLDAQAAKRSILGGLAASGWHLGGVAMRLMVDNLLIRAVSLGSPGVDEVQWRHPVLAGSTVALSGEVLETRVSSGRPDRGFVKFRFTMTSGDKRVMLFVSSLMFGRRAGAQGNG